MPTYISGNAKYIVSINNDITEIIENRKIVEKQKNELEAIVENSSDGIILFNKDGDYIMFNKAARENFVYNIKELKNATAALEQALHTDMEGNLISIENFPSQRVIRGEKFSGYRIFIKNEKNTFYYEMSGTPIFDSSGNLTSGIIVFSDISERLKREENLLIKIQYNLVNRIIDNLEFGLTR